MSDRRSLKLGLGTVQFGLDYGISNNEGKSGVEEVRKILHLADQSGVKVIDTAALYGTSEEALGEALPENHPFSIVTKTPKFSEPCITDDHVNMLEETFYHSLAKMRQTSVYGLLIHHADDLLAENGFALMEKMQSLKQEGLVKKIGVSVYTGNQIDALLERFPIDIIQLPINVLDQRLLAGGHLRRLKRQGVEIHARSVFLQGLLLMDHSRLPVYFRQVQKHLQEYHQMLDEYRVTPLQAALSFVAGIEEIDTLVCGVNNTNQLAEIINGLQHAPKMPAFAKYALFDEAIVNPSLWKINP